MASFFEKWDKAFLDFSIPFSDSVCSITVGEFDRCKGLSSERFDSRIVIDEGAAKVIVITNEQESVISLDSFGDELRTFDYIVLEDVLGQSRDIQDLLLKIQLISHSDTRILILGNNWVWRGLHALLGVLGFKTRPLDKNWLSYRQMESICLVSGFEVLKKETRVFFPFSIPFLQTFLNRTLAWIPGIRNLGMRQYSVIRPTLEGPGIRSYSSLSIVIPTKNEKGNVESAIKRLPEFGVDTEIIFVDGDSVDGTSDEIDRVIKKYPKCNITLHKQSGKGKGNAVREGFAIATKEVLMILDADLTVPPEDLPKFFEAINSNVGEFINGSRLVYPLERDSMRFLNFLANHSFASIFSFILDQAITDTLCGTKVISRKNYIKISEGRQFFGDFDPFGDFDLIFGAAKLNLKIVDLPIHYRSREYGVTQISRFRHGWLLLKMVVFASRKLRSF